MKNYDAALAHRIYLILIASGVSEPPAIILVTEYCDRTHSLIPIVYINPEDLLVSHSFGRYKTPAMEALAAFGVAANVLQIVDFSVKLLSTGHQVLQTGSTVNNSELEVVAKDLRALSENIKRTVRPTPTIMGCLSNDDQVNISF
jgi:hypothetical protein